MPINKESAADLLLSIYYNLLILEIEKNRHGGGRPTNEPPASRYELISWGIFKIIFPDTKLIDIQEYSVYLHNSDVIKDFIKEHSLKEKMSIKDDIVESGICTNQKIHTFFVDTNTEKVVGAFIALMRRIDNLQINGNLQDLLKKVISDHSLFSLAKFNEGIKKAIESGVVQKITLDIGKHVQQDNLDRLDVSVQILQKDSKQYTWVKDKNVVIVDNKIISTYTFFTEEIYQSKILSAIDLIDGCYTSFRSLLSKKLNTNSSQ